MGTALLPTNPSLAGHQTFTLRPGWLKKGVDALLSDASGGPEAFNSDAALVTLGVGKNMVQSIRHWLLVAQLATDENGSRGRRLTPTVLARRLFGGNDTPGWDPYLEDRATIWLIHHLLSGPGSGALTWLYAFSLLREYEFTVPSLIEGVHRQAASLVSKAPSHETVARDVDCFIRSYLAPQGERRGDDTFECPLAALGLVHTSFDGSFRFDVGAKPSLPTPIVAYAIEKWWALRPQTLALSVHDILYAEGSPGQVFKLDEDSLLEYLDQLETVSHGAISFEDTAVSRQVVRRTPTATNPVSYLVEYYEQ